MSSLRRDSGREAEATLRASSLELAELAERLRWFMLLRWVAAGGIVAITAALRWLGEIGLQVLPIFAVAGTIALYNLGFWLHLRLVEARQQRSEGPSLPTDGRYVALAANLQISLDLLLLTALLHFVGGVENPFYMYYVFHVMIAGMLLSRLATFLQAALAVALFTILAALEYAGVIPHLTIAALGIAPAYQRATYVLAVLAALGTTLFLVAYMSTSISGRLRHRERQVVALREELEEAYQRLQQTERVKSQYMLKVSHQLRAPLAAVQSLIAVVLKGLAGPVPEQARDVLERASLRTREALDLVSDLLTLSRARELRPESARQPVDLAEAARKVADLFRSQAEAKEIDLRVSIPDRLPPLLGDPRGIEDVVTNLVSNAIKYTAPGGRVELEVKVEDETAVIRVSDSGIGIPRQEIPRIFQEFYRTEQARETVKEGTGLGLPIVKAIVDAHGGTLEVDSEPGSGSIFLVRLPLSPKPVL